MKTRTLLFIFILISAVFVLFAGGSKKEELYGTWVNTDYDGVEYLTKSAKLIFDPNPNAFGENLKSDIGEPNGSIGWYYNTSDTKTGHESTFAIAKKWTDSEENVWYKINYYDYKFYTIDFLLVKMSNSGNTLEYMFCGLHSYDEIDPNSYDYGIFYRQ